MNFLKMYHEGGILLKILILLNTIGLVYGLKIFIHLSSESFSKKFESIKSGLKTIYFLAQISPMVGLLGTICGISKSFFNMSSSLEQVTQGISFALVTTIFGMTVSIIQLFIHHLLSVSAERKFDNIGFSVG